MCSTVAWDIFSAIYCTSSSVILVCSYTFHKKYFQSAEIWFYHSFQYGLHIHSSPDPYCKYVWLTKLQENGGPATHRMYCPYLLYDVELVRAIGGSETVTKIILWLQ